VSLLSATDLLFAGFRDVLVSTTREVSDSGGLPLMLSVACLANIFQQRKPKRRSDKHCQPVAARSRRANYS
jgi:hypothetical protein